MKILICILFFILVSGCEKIVEVKVDKIKEVVHSPKFDFVAWLGSDFVNDSTINLYHISMVWNVDTIDIENFYPYLKLYNGTERHKANLIDGYGEGAVGYAKYPKEDGLNEPRNTLRVAEKLDGFAEIKSFRFRREVPIYYRLGFLIKDRQRNNKIVESKLQKFVDDLP